MQQNIDNPFTHNHTSKEEEPVWKKYAKRHQGKNGSSSNRRRRYYGTQGQKSKDPLSPSFSHFFSFPLTHLSQQVRAY